MEEGDGHNTQDPPPNKEDAVSEDLGYIVTLPDEDDQSVPDLSVNEEDVDSDDQRFDGRTSNAGHVCGQRYVIHLYSDNPEECQRQYELLKKYWEEKVVENEMEPKVVTGTEWEERKMLKRIIKIAQNVQDLSPNEEDTDSDDTRSNQNDSPRCGSTCREEQGENIKVIHVHMSNAEKFLGVYRTMVMLMKNNMRNKELKDRCKMQIEKMMADLEDREEAERKERCVRYEGHLEEIKEREAGLMSFMKRRREETANFAVRIEDEIRKEAEEVKRMEYKMVEEINKARKELQERIKVFQVMKDTEKEMREREENRLMELDAMERKNENEAWEKEIMMREEEWRIRDEMKRMDLKRRGQKKEEWEAVRREREEERRMMEKMKMMMIREREEEKWEREEKERERREEVRRKEMESLMRLRELVVKESSEMWEEEERWRTERLRKEAEDRRRWEEERSAREERKSAACERKAREMMEIMEVFLRDIDSRAREATEWEEKQLANMRDVLLRVLNDQAKMAREVRANKR